MSNPENRSSILAFAQSRGLGDAEAAEVWQKLPEKERTSFIESHRDNQSRALDQNGRVKRKPRSKKPILILGLVVFFAAIGYWIYTHYQPKYTEWDWPVILLEGSLLTEVSIKSRSVLLLEREEPFESKMELGKGIDLSNTVLAEVVNFETEIQGLLQPEMKTFLEMVSEENQHSTIIREMARASIPTKGLGGGIEYLAQVESNETSIYIIMATTITTKKTRVKNASLKPHIKTLLEANNSLNAFISLYGTHYISGYTNAAQFIGVIEIHTQNKKDKDEIKAALNYTGFQNALAGLEAGLERKGMVHKKNVRMYVQGPNIQKIPMNINELLGAHEEFLLETKKATTMPVAVACSPFTTLAAVQENTHFLEEMEKYTVCTKLSLIRNRLPKE